MNKKLNILIPMYILLLFNGSLYNIGTVFIFFEQLIGLHVAQTNHHPATGSTCYSVSFSQSTYRVSVDTGGVYCPLSFSVHHIFLRDGRYSEMGWASTPTLTRLG
jgi:hypothetical protein